MVDEKKKISIRIKRNAKIRDKLSALTSLSAQQLQNLRHSMLQLSFQNSQDDRDYTDNSRPDRRRGTNLTNRDKMDRFNNTQRLRPEIPPN